MNIRASLLCVFVAYPLGAVALPVQKDFPSLPMESQEIAAALEAAPEHRNAVMDDGKVIHVGPRLLFYAPNLSNADLGSIRDLESRMSVVDEGDYSHPK